MARTDKELVEATLKGENQAFTEIIERYQKLVFNIVYHYVGYRDEVEDLAQEVFLKVFRFLHTFDTERSLKAWVSSITANTCLDEMRKAGRRRTRLFSDLSGDEEERMEHLFDRFSQSDALTDAEVEQLFDLLETVMSHLNEKDRMAFVLRELEGFDYPEIAQIFKATELAVRIRVSRAKKKLHEELNRILYSQEKTRDG
jgi:RNA polymerase sigma-70 factor, ECF subfamily